MMRLLDVVAKGGVIALIFLAAALLFGVVFNAVFSNLDKGNLDDADDFKAAGLLRRVPRGKRKARFPDCTETPAAYEEDAEDEAL